jgi:hypothetical protein
MPQDFFVFLANQRKWVLVAIGVIALTLIGAGDWFASGNLLEFSVFFVLPVSYFAWFLGRRSGFVVSLVSSAIIVATSSNSPVHAINHRVVYWNGLVWFLFFSLVTFLISDLKAVHMRDASWRGLTISPKSQPESPSMSSLQQRSAAPGDPDHP